MERVLLYYPTIELPNTNWIRQAILYGDKVSSILPFEREFELPNSLKELIDSEQYKPIFIEDYINIHGEDYNHFSKRFLNDIDNIPRIREAKSKRPRPILVDSLFRNKLSHELIYSLKERNLVFSSNNQRIFLPENIALYYMSSLAKFISSVSTEDLITPSTDYTRFCQLSFENGLGKDEALNLILRNCLPVPSESVELSKIVKFKKAHRNDLMRFRNTYLSTQECLRKCRDVQDATEAMISLKEKISIELDDLVRLYKKNNISTVLTTLDSLFGLDNPKLFQSLLTAGVISAAIDPIIGISIGALLISCKIVNNNLTKQKTRNDFNYLFEAHRSGLLE